MFADDTQLINKTEESIEETFKTLEIYEKASGAKMNLENNSGDVSRDLKILSGQQNRLKLWGYFMDMQLT